MFLLKSHQQLDFWYQEIVAVSSVLLLAGPSFFGACTSRSPGVFLFLFVHSVITTVPLFWPSVSWLVYGRCCCLSKISHINASAALLVKSTPPRRLWCVEDLCARIWMCVCKCRTPDLFIYFFPPTKGWHAFLFDLPCILPSGANDPIRG